MSEVAIILGAGESRRYKEDGHLKPKPLLIVRREFSTSSMLQHVRGTVPPGCIVVAALPSNCEPPPDFHDPVFYIKETRGQADTAYQVLECLKPEDSVIILDCDMIVPMSYQRILLDALQLFDTSVLVTESFDPNASRVDRVPYPTKFVEKSPISEWGIVGARAFKRVSMIRKALKYVLDALPNEEPYLSTAMNFYPGKHFAQVIDSNDYYDWGTPDRLRQTGAVIL